MTASTTKLLDRKEVADLCVNLRQQGKTIGFTSGVFDILHPGHVDYLEKAKIQCDVLIVGVNSDASVRQNKGELRPICSERDRAAVLAGLGVVDYIFIFDERNNHKNIELLQPHLYLKAGDYDVAKLSSAPLIESYGGSARIIPALPGFSSTRIIEKISAQALGGLASMLPQIPLAAAAAVFVDRDGTIIEHVEYLHEPHKVQFLPGAIDGLKMLKQAGFRLVVVTNQPGIGFGYFTKEEFFAVNREMLRTLYQAGVSVDRVYFCPHTDADKCSCRKPSTALIERAVADLNVVLTQSYVIGDMTLDIQLGKNAGCRTIQVQTGKAGGDKYHEVTPDFSAADLSAAAQWILNRKKLPS